MHDVVDPVALEAEDLREASANLIKEHHAPQGCLPIEAAYLRSGDWDAVEVVVAEFPGSVPKVGVEAEVRAIGVPLADRRIVCQDRFLGRYTHTRGEDRGAVVTWVLQGLLTQDGRCVCPDRQSGESTECRVHKEEAGAIEHLR